MRQTISYSEWGLWRTCRRRWRLEYVDGRRVSTASVDAAFGRCVHSTLELLKNRDPTVRPSVDEACDRFVTSFREERGKLLNEGLLSERDRQKDPSFYESAGLRILGDVGSVPEMTDADVAFNELRLEVPIDRTDDVKMSFKGYVDVGLRRRAKRGDKSLLYICDYKTCSWGWNREKRTSFDTVSQLYLYKHFFCKRFSVDPKLVRTTFILLKKSPSPKASSVEWFEVSAGPVTVGRTLDALQSDITAMSLGHDEPRSDSCVNAYGDRCPFLGAGCDGR